MGKKKCSCKKKNTFNNSYSQSNSSFSSNPILPLCSKFLDNSNPILNGCMWLFRNDNRVYTFLSTAPINTANIKETLFTNLQINFSNYIIGYYISKVQKNDVYYDDNVEIHSNENINTMIHQLMKNKNKIKLPFSPFLRLLVSNSSAILPLINTSEKISSLSYIIVFILHSIERHPGLYFGNNSYILNNYVNQLLAALNISLPFDKLKI